MYLSLDTLREILAHIPDDPSRGQTYLVSDDGIAIITFDELRCLVSSAIDRISDEDT